jgi:hypothetical protein
VELKKDQFCIFQIRAILFIGNDLENLKTSLSGPTHVNSTSPPGVNRARGPSGRKFPWYLSTHPNNPDCVHRHVATRLSDRQDCPQTDPAHLVAHHPRVCAFAILIPCSSKSTKPSSICPLYLPIVIPGFYAKTKYSSYA